MKSIFDLHPAAVAGELLNGRPNTGPAQRDAEPEQDTARAKRRLPRPVLAFRRRRDAAAAARSANA
jgi:hypothetical protein